MYRPGTEAFADAEWRLAGLQRKAEREVRKAEADLAHAKGVIAAEGTAAEEASRDPVTGKKSFRYTAIKFEGDTGIDEACVSAAERLQEALYAAGVVQDARMVLMERHEAQMASEGLPAVLLARNRDMLLGQAPQSTFPKRRYGGKDGNSDAEASDGGSSPSA